MLICVVSLPATRRPTRRSDKCAGRCHDGPTDRAQLRLPLRRHRITDRTTLRKLYLPSASVPNRAAQIESRLRLVEVRVVAEMIRVPHSTSGIGERFAVFGKHAVPPTHHERLAGSCRHRAVRAHRDTGAPATYNGPSMVRGVPPSIPALVSASVHTQIEKMLEGRALRPTDELAALPASPR